MARNQRKCLSCGNPLIGRRDAKTCSDRCRKQLHRAKTNLAKELRLVEQAAKHSLEVLETGLETAEANEAGFIGESTAGVFSPKNKESNDVTVVPITNQAPPTPPPPYDPKTLAPINPITGSNTVENPKYSFYTEEQKPEVLPASKEESLEVPRAVVIQNPTSPFDFRLKTLIASSVGFVVIMLLGVFLLTLKQPASTSSTANLSNADKLNIPASVSTISLNKDTSISAGKKLTATGQVILQNDKNSVAALSVQNASGNDLLVVDTQNNKVGIGAKPLSNGAQLQAVGNISTQGTLLASGGGASLSDQGLVINSVLVCTSAGCISNLSNVARLTTNQTFTGTNTFQTTSATALVVENSTASHNSLTVDTSDNKVGIGAAPTSAGATLQVAGNLNTTGSYQVNGLNGGSFSCGAGELLQQPVIQGGIIISGICVSGSGASIATLQQSYNASTPAQIVLNNVSGLIQIQDAASPLATNLFEITSNGGSTKYFAVNNLGISVTGNINTTGQYQVNGVALASTHLSDTASIARLAANQTFTGNNTFSSVSNSFTGNGAGLTSLNASSISSGTLSDTRLSANVTLQGNTFNAANQLVQLNGSTQLPAVSGSQLTNLNATNISSGTLNDLRLSANVTLQGNTFNGANQLVQLNSSGILPALDGSNLTNLNATALTSGTVNDARLSANVTLQGNAFNSANQLVLLNASTQLPAVSGALLTNLNATNISSGTLSDLRLSANVTLQGNTFNNANQLVQLNGSTQLPAVSGALLTNLNATNVSSGTLSDSRLTSNVALLDRAGQVFTGDNTVKLNSNSAFQVQNASSVNVLAVDTTNNKVTINNLNFAGTGNSSQIITKSMVVTAAVNAHDIVVIDTANPGQVTTTNTANSNLVYGIATTTAAAGATQDIVIGGTYQVNVDATSTIAVGDFIATSTTNGKVTTNSNPAAGTILGRALSAVATPGAGQTVWVQVTPDVGGGSGGSGVTSLGNIDSQPKDATKGAVISGNTLYLQTADTGNPGLVSTGSQSFAGAKTFTGAALFQNAANSTTAFQIQNAAGTSNLLVADTTNSRVAINQAAASYPLDVAGDINSTTGLRVNGVLVCDSSGCTPGSGSGSYIQNGTTTQSANFNIRSAAIGSVGAVIEGANGQTADLLDVQSFGGSTKYLVVNTSGISVAGTVTASGNINSSGGAIQTNGTTRIDNTGNLTNIGTINGNTFTTSSLVFSAASAASVDAASGQNLNLGAGASNHTTTLGSTNGTSTTTVQSGSGGVNLSGNTTVTGSNTFTVNGGNTSLGANLDVTGSVAFKKGTDYSTTGTSNDVNFGNASVIRLTGASAQTITGIANGRDGYLLTIINAASQNATISNNSASSAAANRITTGTGADYSLQPGSGITLVYDAGASLWRMAATGTGVNGIGVIDSQTKSANGAVIVGSNLVLQTADASFPGLVSTSTQTFAGDKTFNGLITGNAGLSISGGAVSLQGNTNSSLTTTSGGTLSLQGSGATSLTTTNTASGSSSNITIASGNVTAGGGASGNVSIDVGTSTGTTGTVSIGTGNASAISLGVSGKTTTVNGALTVSQGLNANGGVSVGANQSISFAAGSGSFDQGSSTGTFATGSGSVSLNGNTTVAAGKNFSFAAGAGNFDLSNSTGTFQTSSGANTLNGNVTVAGTNSFTVNGGNTSLGANLDVTSSVAFKHGVDVSTTGTINDLNIGNVSLVRLSGASTQTLTGIAGGRDGYILTVINAAGQNAVINDNDTNSSVGNRIRTGTGGNISLATNSSITLVYDSQGSFWRVIGDVAGGSGSGVTSVGTFTSCTSYANGAQISGGVITFSCADATNPGMVSTGAQTFVGAKTFSNLITGSAGLSVSGGAVSLSGNAASSLTTSSGALTLTSAAAATWSTGAGALTLQGSGGLNLNTADKAGAGTSNVAITSGNVTSGAFVSGNVNIDVGTSTGATGTVSIGTANASGVSIGLAGKTTTVNGALTVSQATTLNGTVALNGDTTIASGKNLTFTGGASNFDQSASTGTFATGSGAVSLNGDTTVAGAHTFTTGSGNVSLNGNTTLGAGLSLTYAIGSGSFDAHNATGTFQTSSGANSLNGNTTVTGTNTFTVNGGLTTLGAGVTETGAALFQSNSSTGFQVQNSSSSKNVMAVDTSGNKVVLGTAGASGITGNLGFNFSGQTGSISLVPLNPSSTAYTLNLPAENGTLCSTGSVCTGYQAAGSYANTALSNLSSVAINASLTPGTNNSIDLGTAANSWRTLYAATSVLTPTVDTGSAVALNIGTTNATAINLNQNTTLAGGKSLTFAAGAGNFDQSASTGTFATGSGAVSLNGDTTIAAAHTFTTGTGNVSLNGNTTVATNKSFTAQGSALFQDATNSTTAFQVQTSGGASTFGVDTINQTANIQGDLNAGTTFGKRIFSDNFESGTVSQWDNYVTGTQPVAQTTTVHSGLYAAKFQPANNVSVLTYTFGQHGTGTSGFAHAWVDVTSQSSSTLDLLQIDQSSSAFRWSIYRDNSTGKVCLWNDFISASEGCWGSFTTGTWHKIEFYIASNTSTTGVTQVWFDDTQVFNSSNRNNGAGVGIYAVSAGEDLGTTGTGTFYVDDYSANAAVNNGPDRSVNVDDSLHVAGNSSFGSILIQPAYADAKALQVLYNNGVTAFNIDTATDKFTARSDQALFVSNVNSATAFQVQNATGTNLFNVDTANSLVGTAATSTASTNSSSFNLQTGNATGATSNSGNISIDSGTATGTTGAISIGTANASAITIGKTSGSAVTTINGGGGISLGNNVTITGSNTFTTGSGNVSLNGNTTLGAGLSLTYSTGSGSFDAHNATGTFQTSSGANSLNGNTTVTGSNTFTVNGGNTSLGANLDVTGSVAFKKGTDFSTTGTTNNASFANASLIRLTGASTQTITGIAGGRDGYVLSIINAASQAATLANNNTNSTAANRIITGTGGDFSLLPGSAVDLVYDATDGFWRMTSSGVGINSVGTLDAQAASANGASIVGNSIYLQSASGSAVGLVNTSAQTFAGAKTFSNLITGNAGITTSGGAVSLQGNAASSLTTTSGSLTLQGDGGLTLSTTNKAGATTNNITLTSGNVTSGSFASGNVSIDVGTSTGTTGTISIGTANASGVSIGVSGATTTINGALTVTQATTLNGTLAINGDTTVASGKSITFSGGASNFDQSASTGTFKTGTGNVSLNGNTTLGAGNSLTLATGAGSFDAHSATGTFQTSTGNNSLNGNTTVTGTNTFTVNGGNTSLGANLDVTGSVAFKKGTDYSSTGTQADINFANASLIRITSASALTIAGIANGRDGQILTIANTSANPVTINNNDTTNESTAGNRILTGSGQNYNLPVDSEITLIYDATSSRWRMGAAATSVNSVGTLDAQAASANGASIVGNSIYLQSASGSAVGLVNTAAQTFAGAKTFSNLITGNAGITTSGGAVSLQGNAASSLTTTSGALTLQGDGGLTLSTTNKAGATTNNITLTSGNVTSGSFASGNVSIDVGTSTGTTGTISIGTANASGVSIGVSGATTTINGALTVTQATTLNGTLAINGDTTVASGKSITFSGGASNFDQSASTGTFKTGSGAVSLNGDTTIAGSHSFTTGTGNVSLNGNTTLGAGNSLTLATGAGSFDAHSATGTFQTSSGANSLNGNTTVTGTNTFTVNGGLTTLGAGVTETGAALFQSNSSTGFQVQNSSSSKNVLDVDTSGNKVVLGTSGASGITGTLQFNYSGQTGSVTLDTSNPGSTGYTLHLPAENGTLCSTGSVCTGYQAAGSYANTSLSNLSSVAINASLTPGTNNSLDLGTAANSWRTLYAATSVLTPLVDSGSAVALNIGTTNATVINLNQNVSLAAGKSLTITGAATASRPASPTAGMLFYDTTTNQLIQYNGSKWVSDHSANTKIVAANNSSQAAKDAADYVASGSGDQATINTALTAAAGGTVYLMEGTYTVSGSINVPNNTTLSGAGTGTLITIANSFNAGLNMITNTDTTTGTGVIVRDILLDGNSTNQTSGNMFGVYFDHVGSSTLKPGKIINITAQKFHFGDGIKLNVSYGDTILNNSLIDNDNWGIELVSSTDVVITNNFERSSAVGAGGMTVFSSTGTLISNNGFFLNSTGVYMNSSTSSSITGNTFSGNSTGLVVQDSKDTITGNTADGNTIGIKIQSGGNNTLSSNTITGNTTHGIDLSSALNSNITGNKIYDSGGNTANNGIYLSNTSTGNSITDNDITDNAGVGTKCTTTCYAINISDSGSTGNYLSSNHILGDGTHAASINDTTASGNTYSNQPLTENGDASFRNATNSTAAFQIQNATGSNVLSVNTNTLNGYLTNTSFENSSVSTWTYSGAAGGSVSRDTTQAFLGNADLKVITGTTAAAKDGVKSVINSTLVANTTYTLSWYDYISSGTFTDITGMFSYDGTIGNATACAMTNTTVLAGAWTRHTCQFTTGTAGTAPTSSNAIYIVQAGANGGTQRTFYLDAVQLEQASQANAYKETALNLQGTVTSNTIFSGQLTLQPASNLVGGQTEVSQVFTNGSSTGGTVTGYDQNITVSNSSSASTTKGLNILIADNSSQSNSNYGVYVDTGEGTNASQTSTGAYIISRKGAGVFAISNANGTLNDTNSGGLIGQNPGVNISSGQYAIGVKGLATLGAVSGSNGVGVYGQADANDPSVNTYGGYFALTTGSSGGGSALFATNNNASANILQLQDNGSNVLVVGDGGSLAVTPTDATKTIALGSTSQTGTITLGQSTATNTISIGAAAGNGNTQTINIGNSSTAGSTTNVTIGSTIAGTTTIQGASGINIGSSSAAPTVQIGNTANAVSQTINIGNNATASSSTTTVIGSLVGASATTINAGTGNLNLTTNSASASIIAKTQTNSTTAFVVQNTNSRALFSVDTSNSAVTVGNTTDGSKIALAASGNTNAVITKNMPVGGTVNAHDLVVIDSSTNGQVKTTTTANDPKVFGIATGSGTPQDIVIGGTYQVNLLATNQAISPGDYLVSTTTAGKVDKATGVPPSGTAIGEALEAKAANAGGTIWAYVTPGAGGTGVGGSTTLQQAYDFSTSSPQITLDSSPGANGLVVQDNSTPLASHSLFTVQNNGGTSKYLDIRNNGFDILGAGASTITTNSGNLTIDVTSGSTPTLNIGTGAQNKAIAIGNSQSSTTVTSTAGAVTNTLSNTGDVIKTNTNSTTAFQVQGSGSTLFTADTFNSQIDVGNVLPNSNSTVSITYPSNDLFTTGLGQSSIVIGSDGYARIAYQDASGHLTFSQCTNFTCTTANTSTIDATVGAQNISMVLGSDGYARISYEDATHAYLKFAQCLNASCSSSNTNVVDNTVSVQYTSVAIGSDGNARIAYSDGTNGRLKLAVCSNAACSASSTNTVTSTATSQISMAYGSDGFLRIAFAGGATTRVNFAQCLNATCTSSNINTVDGSVTAGFGSISMALGSDTFARISYYDQTNTHLKFAQCTNAACSTVNLVTVDSSGNNGSTTSVTLGTDGFARIAYYDATNQHLKYAQCTNSSCSSSTLTTVDSATAVGQYPSIVLGLDGYTRISYDDSGNNKVKMAIIRSQASATGINIGANSNSFANIYAANVQANNFYLQPVTDNNTAFQLLNAAGSSILSVDTTSTGNITVGNGVSTTLNGSLTATGSAAFYGSATLRDSTNSVTAFQVQNSSATNLLTGDTTNMRVGVDVTYSSMGTGFGTPTVTDAGAGSLASGSQYYYEITAIDSAGGETTPSAQGTIGATGHTALNISWTAITGASGYKIYRTTISGSYGASSYLTTVLTNSYKDAGSVALSSGTPPTSNTANTSTNNSNSLLQLSVGGLGTPTGQVYVSGILPNDLTSGGVSTRTTPISMSVVGRYAYVINYSSGKLQVFDVSNPTSPTDVSSGGISTASFPQSVYVAGHYAYIVSGNPTNKLQVFDVSNPTSPNDVSSGGVATGTNPISIYVRGRYAYVADNSANKLQIFDISNPTSPNDVSSGGVATGTSPSSIYVQGRYAYVADNSAKKLQVFDVSNPASPTDVSSGGVSTTNGADTVYIRGRYAYVGEGGSPGKLQVFDVSNPASPTDVSSGGVSTSSDAITVSVQGRYAYIINETSGKLQVFDVSNPTSPVDISAGGSTTNTQPDYLYVSGRYAYVVSQGNNKLQVFDLGGTYAQQLEAGSGEFGTIQVDSNGQVAGDFNVQGGLQIGQGLQTGGNLGVAGNTYVQGGTILGGNNNLLPVPGTPSVSFTGVVGGSVVTWSYVLTAVNSAGETTASSAGSISAPGASNSTLDATHHNDLSWSAVTGATSYKIYRTAATGGSPSTTGYIGSTTGTSFSDTGLAGAGNSAPTANTTGQLTVLGTTLVQPSASAGTSLTASTISMPSDSAIANATKTAISISAGAITEASASTGTFNGLLLSSPGAIGTTTAAGTLNWNGAALTIADATANFAGSAINANGLKITTGNITQTAGSVSESGLYIDSSSTTFTGGGSLYGETLIPSSVPSGSTYTGISIDDSFGGLHTFAAGTVTTGIAMNLYSTTVADGASVTGLSMLTPSDSNINNAIKRGIYISPGGITQATASTGVYYGIQLNPLGSLSTTTAAGTLNWDGAALTIADATANFAGSTIGANGLLVTTGAMTQTAGTLNENGIYVDTSASTSSTWTGGTLAGANINLGAFTVPSGGAFYGLNIGTNNVSRSITNSCGFASCFVGVNVDLLSAVLAGGINETGISIKTTTDQNAANSTKEGLVINGATTLKQNTALGNATFNGADISNPNLTLASGTSLSANGLKVTTGTMTQTVGTLTQNGIYVDTTGTSTWTGGGTLAAANINLGNLSVPSGGTFYGLNISTNGTNRTFTNSGSITGINLDFSNGGNNTATGVGLTGISVATPTDSNLGSSAKTGLSITSGPLTQATAATGQYNGIFLVNSGVPGIQTSTAAGTLWWNGANITTPGATLGFASSTIAENGITITNGAATTNTSGTLTSNGVKIATGNITQTAGTLNENGLAVDLSGSLITTGGTLTGVNVTPMATEPTTGTLTGINVGAITTGGNGATSRGIQVGAGWDTGIYVKSGSTTAMQIQDASTINVMTVNASTHTLAVWDSTGANSANISYSGGTAIFAASSGTTQVGSGTGTVSILLGALNDQLLVNKTYTTAANYTNDDFKFTRQLTGGSGNNLQGSVLRVEDLSSIGSGGTSSPDVVLINQSNASATGNLINAELNGSTKFKVDTTGAITAPSLTSSAGLSLTGTTTASLTASSGGVTITASGTSSFTTSSGNLTLDVTGASTPTLSIGTGAQAKGLSFGNSQTGTTISETAGGVTRNLSNTGQTLQGNSATLLAVNNSNGGTIIGVDSTNSNSNNLIGNPSIESAIAAVAGNWKLKGSATVAQDSTQHFNGSNSLKVTTGGVAGDGAQQQLSTTLSTSSKYVASFYVLLDSSSNFTSGVSGMSTLQAGYSSTGASDDTPCTQSTSTAIVGQWTKVTCSFTTPASTSSSNYFYVKATDTIVYKYYIDGVLLQTDANAQTNYREGGISLQGAITSNLMLQNATNSNTAFTIQNAAGTTVFNVDTTDNNLITNPGFEVNTTGWAVEQSGATIARDASTAWLGNASLQIVTLATANQGAKFVTGNAQPTKLAVSSQYTLSWYAKSSNSFTDIKGRYSVDGGTTFIECTPSSQTVSTVGWTRFSCNFTTAATVPSSTAYIAIVQTAGSARTFWIDGVQLVPGISPPAYGAGNITLNGVITSPVLFQNSSNSTTAFQVQNNGGTAMFTTDTLNSLVQIGPSTASPTATLLVISSDSDATYNQGTATNAATPVNGAMFYSSTDHNFLCGTAGSWITCNGLLYSNTAASAAVNTCTNACAAFNKAAPIPANYCQAGRVIHIYAKGTWGDTTSAPTIAFSVYYGTDGSVRTNDSLIGAATPTATGSSTSASGMAWNLDLTIICQSTTSMNIGGTYVFQPSTTTTTTNIMTSMVATTTSSLTTNTAKNLYIFPTFGTSNASNSVTLQQLIVTGN